MKWPMSCYETLRRQSDFDRVFEQGTWRRAPAFAIGVFERADKQPSRVGFVAGRALGPSVRRNRARRRLREAFRRVAEGLKPGADIVVLARQQAPDIQFGVLSEAMPALLVKAGLLEKVTGAKDCAQ